MTFSLAIQYATDDSALPSRAQVRRWVKSACEFAAEVLAQEHIQLQLTIRYVDQREGRELNRQFRHKDYATNVLTFAESSEPPAQPKSRSKQPHRERSVIADIAICASVVAKEAKAQKKLALAHHAHMVIHGTLHALGFDHENEADALHMETLETQVLHRFRIKNPYA
ncbi:MAG: rRNA maturation RNase YbeY [Burkholderiales bacterium]|nr:MAG: rRNA maturation RNase YbeY [Burkholderiales bacterium]TAG83185.1 MAG: rRNA maturation RNase YbeY [Betaproteobacteria bacterium]